MLINNEVLQQLFKSPEKSKYTAPPKAQQPYRKKKKTFKQDTK